MCRRVAWRNILFVNLDENEINGPNPPPWGVHYINDQTTALRYNDALPEAHTVGLKKVCDIEIMVRFVPPNIAGPILDSIGIWLMRSGEKLRIGDTLRVFNITYIVMPALDILGKPIFRLAWEKDPPLTSDQILTIYKDYKEFWTKISDRWNPVV